MSPSLVLSVLSTGLLVCGLLITAVVKFEREQTRHHRIRSDTFESILLKMIYSDVTQPDLDEAERVRLVLRRFIYEQAQRQAEGPRDHRR